MANLRCDECGGSTNAYGSWDTPIKILCEKCYRDRQVDISNDSVVVDNTDNIK